MVDFIKKGFWLLLPHHVLQDQIHLRIAPFRVVPQHNRCPRVICDFFFHGQNDETLPLAPDEAMQFRRALECYLRRIVLADPRLGPIYMIKVDISDGFYQVGLNVDDVVKLAMAFPTKEGQEPLLAVPLVLPMGWKNSPSIFCAPTEMIADITNQHLLKHQCAKPHHLNTIASSIPTPSDGPKLQPLPPTATATSVPEPSLRDPSLCACKNTRRLAAFEIFVDNFLGVAQGSSDQLQQVHCTLLHAINDVFRPLDNQDHQYCKEPTSVKKLCQGDASWSTIKEILGWIINTERMTLMLLSRRAARLDALLASINRNQKCLTVCTWHKILGELRLMSIALPGA